MILIRQSFFFLTQAVTSCLRSTSLLQYVAPPLPIDGKMATEDGDMDPDMEMLSDEELERYCELCSCCQQLKCT